MNESKEQARARDTKINVALYNAATNYAEYVMSDRSDYDEAMKLAGALEDAAVAYAKIAGGREPKVAPTAEAIAGSLQRPGSAWQNASDCKPKTGSKVLVCGHWDNGNRWRTIAAWYPAGTLDATMWDDPPEDWWDEQENTATNPTDGWMEMAIEGEQMYGLENVTHWMPLPEMPMPNI